MNTSGYYYMAGKTSFKFPTGLIKKYLRNIKLVL